MVALVRLTVNKAIKYIIAMVTMDIAPKTYRR